MKKRIRKTGEIVDVISSENVLVSYIDSDGNTWANIPRNPFEDFEDVEEEPAQKEVIDWEKVRINAAIDAMNAAITANWYSSIKDDESYAEAIAEDAVLVADALIAELKKGGNQ